MTNDPLNRITYGEAAKQALAEFEDDCLWFGEPNIWHRAYEIKNGHNDCHPIKQYQAVLRGIQRSPLFKLDGHIKTKGWYCMEVRHPVYKLIPLTS